MTEEEWKRISGSVTDAMNEYTRPFVTPLTVSDESEVKLVGSGSYVALPECIALVTCEHVKREGAMEFSFFGADDVFRHPGPWSEDPRENVDLAFAKVADATWRSLPHQASAVPYERFASLHRLTDRAELLFVRAFAGENAAYAFGVHQANASGYCTQEIEGAGDASIFEMFWEPEKVQFSEGTTEEARKNVLAVDAKGFSGSLVWNTRYVETRSAGKEWSPSCAVVTGLLRRWDTSTKTLLAWRVEHLRSAIEASVLL